MRLKATQQTYIPAQTVMEQLQSVVFKMQKKNNRFHHFLIMQVCESLLTLYPQTLYTTSKYHGLQAIPLCCGLSVNRPPLLKSSSPSWFSTTYFNQLL